LVLDGSYILSADGVGVSESFYNVKASPALAARQAAQLARIAVGDVASLPQAGPPVVALFLQDCNNFGHVLAEHLPRLLHLAALGLRKVRLLIPEAAETFREQIGLVLRVLGIEAEPVPCARGTIVRVKALHFCSLVGQGWFKSPTVLRLFQHLRAAVPAGAGPERLYVARPDGGRRQVTNALETAEIAAASGFTVVEPSRLAFADQLALFARARHVAGPFGAGLTLTGAMPSGGCVGMVGPGYCDYFYWDLACLAGLDFHWAFAAPVEPFRMELLERDMTIPPRLLRRLLERVVDDAT
jgi:capsular polysaccharide biosynthesis protein